MKLKKLLLLSLCLNMSIGLSLSNSAMAHGLMENPASRNWICGATTKPDQVDNGTAEHPECGTAFATNSIAGYSFMSVLTHAQGRSVVSPLPNHVCSFDSETWKGAQTPWDVPMDWPTQPMGTGEQTITWNISWGPHFDDTAEFRYWITKADFQFSPTRELTWDDFESAPFCVQSYDDKNPTANPDVTTDKATSHFYTKCNIPERSGHHVIYGEWGRLPPTYERFHGCVDASFSGTPPETVTASMSYSPAASSITGSGSIQFDGSASAGTNLSYNWTLESVNPALYSFVNTTSAQPTLNLLNPQAETLFTVRLTVSNGVSSNTSEKTFTHYPSAASDWMDLGAVTSVARELTAVDTVRVRLVDSQGADSYFPVAAALLITQANTAASAWPLALATAINNEDGDIEVGVLNNGVVTPIADATANRIYAKVPNDYVAAYLMVNAQTSSSSSSSTSAVSSAVSSSSAATSEKCNWYGSLYALCTIAQEGWGWENNTNCISRAACSAQPAPYGIVGGSGSSSSQVSSNSSSLSSAVSSSSSVTSSAAVSSSSSSQANSSSGSTASGVLFSENFDGAAVNTQPSGWDNFLAWNYNAANSNSNSTYALIDNSKAHSGSQSIHFKGNLSEIVRALPAGVQRLHLRAYVNLSKQLGNEAGDNHEHIMGIKATPDANNEVRVGQIKGVLGTNEVPSDNIAPTMDKWYSGTQLNANTWYCVETAMYADTDYDQLYLWVDGNLVHSITSGADWNNGALGADWLSGKFNYVMFGFHSFSNNSADVWMDDIVVSTEAIGCDNSSSSAASSLSSLGTSSASSISSSNSSAVSSSVASSSVASSSIPSSSSSAATSSAASSTAAAAQCTYVVTNQWNTGFTGAIRITNNSSSVINGWNVSWSYSDGTQITNSWNATMTGTNPYAATGLSWNSNIQPGQTVEFGFQGNKGSSSSAQVPSVTGSVCQ